MEPVILFTLNKDELKELLKQAVRDVMKEDSINLNGEDEDYLNTEQAAKFLHYKVSTIYDKTSNKEIPFIKKGGRNVYLKSELEQWLKEGKVKTKKELEAEASTFTLKKELSK
ncbi:MAG: helix-turn-helix domain-containing protein [Bacteroidetes bacterium]|nr:helix-turn-helix domain-containing protein [Bacteroidota bacterium]